MKKVSKIFGIFIVICIIFSCGSDKVTAEGELKIKGVQVVEETKTTELKVINGDTDITSSCTWTSSDSSVATVDNGIVSGISNEKVTISAECNGDTVSTDVYVAELISSHFDLENLVGPVFVRNTLPDASNRIHIDHDILYMSVMPGNIAEAPVILLVSDEDIAKMQDRDTVGGNYKLLSVGGVAFAAVQKVDDKYLYDICYLEIVDDIRDLYDFKVDTDGGGNRVSVGGTGLQLRATLWSGPVTVFMHVTDSPDTTYTSSDESIAVVNNGERKGLVTGVSPGRATITVSFHMHDDEGDYGITTQTFDVIVAKDTSSPPQGDVNGDGTVDKEDVILIARHIIDPLEDIGEFSTEEADVSEDDEIKVNDVVQVLQSINGE